MLKSRFINTTEPFLKSEEPRRLLVVDDDAGVRLVSRLALEKSGFAVTDASDGFTALSWLKSHKFDAILLDARMPGMDGFTACRQMREFLNDDPVPIVIATGQDDDASIDAAFECGATDFATKPLNWRIISKRLDSLITASKTKKSLHSRSHQISSMLKTSSEATLVLDQNGVIEEVNKLERLPSEVSLRIQPGRSLRQCLPEECVAVVQKALERALQGDSSETFVLYYHEKGNCYTLQGRFVAGLESDLLCLLQDLSDAFNSEQKMLDLAYTDPSTGVANEQQLMAELNQRLRADIQSESNTLMIRLAGSDTRIFEPRVGRQGMGKLARAIVERIEIGLASYVSALPDSAALVSPLIARISDTDFVIVLSGLHTVEFCEELADILIRRLATNFDIDGYSCQIDWTAGIADSLSASATVDGFMGATAYAIHSEEPSEGRRVHRYNGVLQTRIYQDIEVERLLRRDIADGVLDVHYQPKFDLSGLSLIGMEALIRWTNTELGFVSPAHFIPIAEKSGLIVPLSHLVINKVFDQIVAWREQGRQPVPISINISGIHLNTRTIVEELRAGIEQRRIPPHLVELEVTESIMVDGVSKALKNLTDLRDMGIRVAIDDFGTGYSSLSYLRKLPIDCLKIDRSFVSSITTDPTAQAIARAIITVGHDVGLHVIAEGVETEEQLRCLGELGCDSVQGYFTGRPVPSADFVSFFDGAQLSA